jgi:phage-related protein
MEKVNEINFYETESGRKPAEDFLDSLNSKAAQKVTWVLRLIEERQGGVHTKYFEKLRHTDDIWEVKAKCGGSEYRMLGFIDEKDILFLVHGFQKKSQKTPKKDIDTAEIRKKDHLRRLGNE